MRSPAGVLLVLVAIPTVANLAGGGALSVAAAVTGAPLPLWYALAYTAGLVLVLRAGCCSTRRCRFPMRFRKVIRRP
ncbi:hypothetical protein AB0392_41490 [Nonomuraea angiospora]|uniref:hypothetical protein n=1 Tax=Nonomuraea angiospora TaxID=46172 RepID=UPI00344C6DCF